jgi:hypothetical protein
LLSQATSKPKQAKRYRLDMGSIDRRGFGRFASCPERGSSVEARTRT